MAVKRAIDKGICPVSHGSCRFCTLFRSRHYQAFRCCQDYLRQHQKTLKLRNTETNDNR